MKFTFEFEIEAVSIVEGQLLECQDETCSDAAPLEERGPQRFTCTESECSSIAYGYAPYHRLVITFADRTRESNVFEKSGFAARYVVTVSEDALLVTEKRGLGRLCSCPGLALTLVLEATVAAGYVRLAGLPRSLLAWAPMASLLTLPAVWLGFPLLPLPDGWVIGLAEGFAVLFEAGFLYLATYRQVSLGRAMLLSAAMNAASLLVGWVAL
ncbi:MAG: hypothetical protein HXY24_15570 [Rubrivivax sp.]|nr:hypothetical protein [Rubrivivax sp.]